MSDAGKSLVLSDDPLFQGVAGSKIIGVGSLEDELILLLEGKQCKVSVIIGPWSSSLGPENIFWQVDELDAISGAELIDIVYEKVELPPPEYKFIPNPNSELTYKYGLITIRYKKDTAQELKILWSSGSPREHNDSVVRAVVTKPK